MFMFHHFPTGHIPAFSLVFHASTHPHLAQCMYGRNLACGHAWQIAMRSRAFSFAAAIKPFSTWAALDILQESREACGGAGFLAENRFTQLRQDLDIYVTFEGDNNVLLQLVAKRLLADYAKQFKNADAFRYFRLISCCYIVRVSPIR